MASENARWHFNSSFYLQHFIYTDRAAGCRGGGGEE